MSSSGDEEQPILDSDIYNEIELEKSFQFAYNLSSEEAISLKKTYILHLTNTNDFGKIAASTTDQTVHIFDVTKSTGLSKIIPVDATYLNSSSRNDIVGIEYSRLNSNILSVASANGEVNVYDLRAPKSKPQKINFEISNGKSLLSFALNSDDTILCAGTEQSSGEAYLLFYDLRNNASLATYTDSHKDDVTQVQFHPTKSNYMASGSTDGLINVFNIAKPEEDDALEYCLNTESSVQSISWHPTASAEENLLGCITHTNDFHLFAVEESESKFHCTRDDITKSIKRKSSSECYLVNSHSASNGDVVLFAGSNSNRGEVLRSLTYCKDVFEPRTDFHGNKQIIRCSLYNQQNDTLITAGEGGIVTIWESRAATTSDQATTPSSKLKEKKHKDRKSKPY